MQRPDANAAEIVWRPDPTRVADSHISAFRDWLRSRGIVDASDYDSLWRWSVTDLASFWTAVAQFFDVAFHQEPTTALVDAVMPGTQWFPGATLNYAEQALRSGAGKRDGDVAVIFRREDGLQEITTYGQLRQQVALARRSLAELGVRRGDRVAALAANCPQTLVAFLATASLGAIWSSCSPDFGVRAAADRFAQLEPTVLIAVDGYVYGGRTVSIGRTVDALRRQLPSLKATICVTYARTGVPDGALVWDEVISRSSDAPLDFQPVSFDHPLWILFSSGTTGLPKGIVHGHGGITLEHLKTLALHFDAGPGSRFLWFTTTGWMMWNFLIGGLLTGSTVVLYDGSPSHPRLDALWQLVAEQDVTVFGTSAPFIHACLKTDVTLDQSALSALRIVGSTGSPLSADGFRWLRDAAGPTVQIASFSGGSDVCTGFLGPTPDMPVWLGELSRPALGAAVAAYDDSGHPVVGQMGELVLTRPMPSMPVSFWNDPDGSRLFDAYFATFPGVWRHGDWITITPHGSAIIHGRSDATLNRSGIRMGTAEFYRIIEAHHDVVDSLVIDTSNEAAAGRLLCFVVLAANVTLSDVETDLRHSLRAQLSPRHVPDRFIAVDDIPRTLTGKKCEVPVKKILAGVPLETAVSAEALSNPTSLDVFVRFAASEQANRHPD
jgi:acetoacetyl-CoA synthetase